MPDLYYNAMREALQRDMMQLIAQNARLTERVHALEQLVEQGIVLLDTHNTKEADAWLHRAKAVLQGEDRKESE